jgi:hypothetical protein
MYGFIFVKTKKTAGTSIELALSPHCGPQDTVSPISVKYDLERAAAGILPRNFGPPEIEGPYVAALQARSGRLVRQAANLRAICNAHAPAFKIKAFVGDAFWNTAFKFTAERHPYEKALSLAWHKWPGEGDFATHLDRTVKGGPYVGHTRWRIGGEPVIDDIVRQESLERDMARIATRLGLPALEFPTARKRDRDRSAARDVLSDEQKKIVRQRCKPEFEMLGWEP